MQKIEYEAILKHRYQLACDTVRLDLYVGDLAGRFQAGQFLEIETNGILKRPFACMAQDAENGMISLGVKIVGEKSQFLANLPLESKLSVFAPLGHGFRLSSVKKLIAVGGGSGIFALTAACKQLSLEGRKVFLFCGYRTSKDAYPQELLEIGNSEYICSSDQGGLDFHGNAVDAMKDYIMRENIDVSDALLIACGPKGLLKACQQFSRENNLNCQLSLEENMACGLGYCLGCAVDVIDEQGEHKRLRCCVEGPVFQASQLIL